MAIIPLFLSLLSLAAYANTSPTSPRSIIRRSGSVTGPTPRLVQYVQTFHVNGNSNEPLSLLPLAQDNSGVTHVIFAMTHLNSNPGDIHLNDNPYNSSVFDQAWSDGKQLQAAGIKLMATMGGAGDGSYQHLTDDVSPTPSCRKPWRLTRRYQFTAYYEPLAALIRNYSLDGFDLDIEESTDLSTALQLINALFTDFGSDFLITMAPVASALQSASGGDLSGFSYFDLDAQAVDSSGNKLVSWYNAQFYSGFGDPSSTSDYDTIVSAGFDPSRVVMGVLDSPNDGSGYVDTSTVEATIASLKAKYPTFGGVDGWEYFDAGAGDNDAEPYEWDQAIGGALGTTSAKKHRSTSTKKSESTAAIQRRAPHPWDTNAIETLQARGATYFEAVRALNRTSGDSAAAESLYNKYRLLKCKN
jgi:hypothetical protein